MYVLDSLQFLHVALNSAALHFVAIKTYNYNYGQDFRFNHETKPKAVDKTLQQRFLKEFKATCKNSGESELKQQKVTWNAA